MSMVIPFPFSTDASGKNLGSGRCCAKFFGAAGLGRMGGQGETALQAVVPGACPCDLLHSVACSLRCGPLNLQSFRSLLWWIPAIS